MYTMLSALRHDDLCALPPLPPASNQQHLLAELCYALSLPITETAAATGLPLEYLTTLQESPLFLAEVERIRQRFAAQAVQSASTKLQSEALASVERLVEIRDNPILNIRERRLAATDILDRVSETSKSHHIKHEHSVGYSLSDKQFSMLLNFINGDPLAQEAFEKETISLSAQDYSLVNKVDLENITSPSIADNIDQPIDTIHSLDISDKSTINDIKESLHDFLSIKPDKPAGK